MKIVFSTKNVSRASFLDTCRFAYDYGFEGFEIYDALKEKGYNPLNQIVGYILSEDPTYITNHNNARALIRKIDRDELLGELVKSYLDN